MYSCALMNGQHQQVGPPSMSMQAAAPLTYNTMRNQQAATADNLYQYRTVNTGVQPPQTTLLTNGDGAYSNKQRSNVLAITVPYQVGFSQQPAGVTINNYPPNAHNVQSGNPCFLLINGSAVSTKPIFYQNFAQNSKTQTPPGHPPSTTTYAQQNMSALRSQPVTVNGNQPIRTQGGNVASNFQQHSIQKSLHYNGNGKPAKAYPAYVTKATSQPQNQLVYTCTLLPPSAHNTQTAPNQNYRQNVTQRGLSPSTPLPSYNKVVSQPLRDNNITTNSSSGGQMGHVLLSQKTQQHSAQLNLPHGNGGEATASINSNSNSCRYEVSSVLQKPNECPSNPHADAQQELLRRQMIATIEDNLRNSYTAGSDGCCPVPASSSHVEKPFVSEGRPTECNQTVRHVTSTAAESCNPSAAQLLPFHPGQSLPNTTQSVTSRTQHAVNAPPQQSSAPDVYVTTMGHGNGSEAGRAFFPKNDSVSNGNLAALFSDATWTPLPETQRSVENGKEIFEKPSLVKPSDSSIHSSPGRAATRAVAVVQPLSQESYPAAHKHTPHNTISQLGERAAADVSLSDPEKLISPTVAKNNFAANLKEGFNVNPENPDHMRSDKSVIGHSAAPSDGAVVSSSGSAGPWGLSQQQSCAKDKRYELAANMQVDRRSAPAARQSVTDEVPASQNTDNNEMLANPKECVFDLSSIPTTSWLAVTLNNLIWLFDGEKAQVDARDTQDVTKFNSASKILNMFWDGDTKTLVRHLKTGMYKALITDVREFCNKHITQDSVILTQVKQRSGKHFHGYYVLKDDEVYSELPYRSSWLNVNEQVDDIDRDFGFSRYLTHRLHTSESGSKPHMAATVNSIPAQTVSEAPNKVLPQKELEPVDSGEEKQASTETQTSSPDRTESADSADPCYSFEIQVLPPEEAKLIFEQLQSKMPQSKDADSPPEIVMKRSVEDRPPDVRDVTQSGSKVDKTGVAQIDQICCIARWIQQIAGSEGLQGTSLSKCRCKKERSHEDSIDKPLDRKEMTVKKNDKLCGIRSESKSHFATKGENRVKAGENSDSQILMCVWPDLSRPTIDLTEDDEEPLSHSGKETNNNSQMSLDDSQSSLILISENKHDNLSSSESEIPNLILDFGIPVLDPEEEEGEEEEEEEEEECVQGQLKSPGSSQSSTSGNSKMGIKMGISGEDCAQVQLASADVADVQSSLKTKGQFQISAGASLRTTSCLGGKRGRADRKRKTLSSHEGIFPFQKKRKKCRQSVHLDSQPVSRGVKCKKGFVDAADSKPSAPKVKTAELMLFGSAGQRMSNVAQRPPEIICVDLSPHRRKSSVPTGEYSAKQWIYEKWRRSYPPPKMRRRRKPKTQYKCTFASLSRVSLKKVETAGLPGTKEPQVSSEMSVCDGNAKQHCLSWTKKRAHRLRLREEKTKREASTLRRPDQEGGADDESHAVMSLKEKCVLNFSVLPNTFNFVDGSNRRKRTTRPVSDNSDLGERKDKVSSETATSPRRIWCSHPEKRYCALRSHSVPSTSVLFHKFQKKYMEKKEPSATK